MVLANGSMRRIAFLALSAFEAGALSSISMLSLTIAVSCALGFVGGKIVRAFKMRNTVVAVACAVVGFLFASYFKWALYDYNDLKKYGYELMGEYTAMIL